MYVCGDIQVRKRIITNEREDTLLIHAARLGKEDVVDLLLLAGAHIEATNKVTKTVKLGYVIFTEYTCMHTCIPFLYIEAWMYSDVCV